LSKLEELKTIPVISQADALFSKTQQRVLGLLFGKPDRRFYTNEIVRWADMGRGTITRELERMTRASILISYKEGNQRYFQANSDNPIFEELINLVRKTFGVVDVIKNALMPLYSEIEYAFIYGSIAKKTENKNSDIDLMLIGKEIDYSDIMQLLIPAEDKVKRNINPTIYTSYDFKKKLQGKNSFVSRVMEQEKLVIKGKVDELYSASGIK